MKTKTSAGLAIIYDNKVLLAHTTNRGWYGSYGIPKGGIEEGESKLDAAIRETKEEVGISVPKNLIDKTEYTFTLTTRKYKYTKIVYYYVVKIDDLNQIGLKDLKVPKKQLQVEEVDWAGFMDYKEAIKRVMKSQLSVINNLVGKGLLEKEFHILKFKDFGL
jgi:8-oxo-dGTP pyrophosphatase MutT (NUDIX family)